MKRYRESEIYSGDGTIIAHIAECDECKFDEHRPPIELSTYNCWSCDEPHTFDEAVYILDCKNYGFIRERDGHVVNGTYTLCPKCYHKAIVAKDSRLLDEARKSMQDFRQKLRLIYDK